MSNDINGSTVIEIRKLHARNRGEKPGVSRDVALHIECLNIPYGAHVLIIGARGAGKGALIDCIDRNEIGIEYMPSVCKIRVNSVDDLTRCSNSSSCLILSEGNKITLQLEIIARAPSNATILASVDRDQIVSLEVMDRFTHVLLLDRGAVRCFLTTQEFLEHVPAILRDHPHLETDFPELKNLF